MIINDEPIINVGIVKHSIIEFELKGSFSFQNNLIEQGHYKALINNNSIELPWTKGESTICLQANSQNATFVIKNVQIGIGFHWQQNQDQEFEGSLTLKLHNGEIWAINNIALESYLKSVISSEMSAMNNPTLLQVHAIISRSWLLSQISKQKNTSINNEHARENIIEGRTIKQHIKWYDREDHDIFDVCADDHCQRYQGISKIISENALEAVNATRGKVLMFENEICDTRYSKCCGGISENFENVWENKPKTYLTAISDSKNDLKKLFSNIEEFIVSKPQAYCNTSNTEVLKQVLVDFDQKTNDFFRWETVYSQKELSALIKRKSGIDFGNIIDLKALKRGISGRITKLLVKGDKNEIVVGKELAIRKWLSETHLYSSAFVIEKHYKNNTLLPYSFKLKGAGWGHGVGLCQIGAAVMAIEGFSVDEILYHYFNRSNINVLY
ncbi:MAG: SpoIID/LytB domain-containing protein [Prolixibacteraceae bacterium]|nr:SpoIID/LytB domain-containing protein [Prolixibacteraceae bacterium]